MKEKCIWQQDYYASIEGRWDTDCGESFYLSAGTPEENKMQYCPYCGKPILQLA